MSIKPITIKYSKCEICQIDKTTRTQCRSKYCHKCAMQQLYQEERKNMSLPTKVCNKCLVEKKNTSEFFPIRTNSKTLKHICKSCDCERRKREYRNNIRREKNTRLKNDFNISIETYENMLNAQNGVCAICSKKPNKKRLAVDHCHKTGKIRGLLCSNCNTGIGKLKDDKTLLAKAIEYLK